MKADSFNWKIIQFCEEGVYNLDSDGSCQKLYQTNDWGIKEKESRPSLFRLWGVATFRAVICLDMIRTMTHFYWLISKNYTLSFTDLQGLHTFIALFSKITHFYCLISKDYTLLLTYLQQQHNFIALFSKITHFY